MRRARRPGIAALILGLAAALLLHGQTPVPPLYDGIVVPPAPYRWESPPPNLRNGNQPPESGETTLPVLNGQVSGGGVQTSDSQVIMYFGPGTFKPPAGATSIKCTIEPLANPPPPPSGWDIRGNVYRIGCAGQPSGGTVTPANTFHLTLRMPAGPANDIQYYDGQSWHQLTTLFAPQGDPFASVNAPTFGEYAVMARTGASSSGDGLFSTLTRYAEFYGILALVIIFGVIAVVQEIRRRRHQRPSKKS